MNLYGIFSEKFFLQSFFEFFYKKGKFFLVLGLFLRNIKADAGNTNSRSKQNLFEKNVAG